MRYVCAIIAIAAAIVSTGSANLAAVNSQAQAPASSPAVYQALINQYCVTCHNQRAKTAGLMFDTMDLSNVAAHADVWEKAVRKLRGGMMPPPGARKPDAATVESFVSWLET